MSGTDTCDVAGCGNPAEEVLLYNDDGVEGNTMTFSSCAVHAPADGSWTPPELLDDDDLTSQLLDDIARARTVAEVKGVVRRYISGIENSRRRPLA